MTQNIDLYHKRNQNLVQNQPSHALGHQEQKNILEKIQDQIEDFFSKGYNIVRLIFFIIILIYLLYVFVSALSSVPEGESLTISMFYNHILQNFKDLRESFPIFEYFFTKISNLISAKQVNFLIFLSSMLGTLLLLMCFCP